MDSAAASSSAGASNSSQDPESTWSTTIKQLNIQPFTSPVGPIQDISSSPLEVFDLFFSPDLMERIVRESNAYAMSAMGNEKYERWSKMTVELRAFLGFSVLMGKQPPAVLEQLLVTRSPKQYMPLKSTKRGIKVWVAADSTNDNFSRFEVYTGKNNTTEHDLGTRVVKTLTSDLKGKYHHVYFDNYFTSLKLL